jgi:hypothetical protein
VIFDSFLELRMAESGPPYLFLPLALAGFATVIIFGVQWFAEPFPDRNQSFQQGRSTPKGAPR